MDVKHLLEFGDFTLNLNEEKIFAGNIPLSLTPKSFQLLKVLAENPGKILGKDELMSKVWQDSFVEEGNLTFNIRQIRKTLKDDTHNPTYIETIPRRGYRFIANVRKSRESDEKDVEVTDLSKEFAEIIPARKTNSLGFAKLFLLPTVVCAAILIISSYYFPNKAKNSGLQILTRDGATRQAAISPDGRFMTFVNRTNEKESLWLRDLESNTNIRILEASDKSFGLVRFSSQNEIYFVRQDSDWLNSLYKTSLIGGTPIKLITNISSVFSVSPDNENIVFDREDSINRQSKLILGNIESGTEIEIGSREFPNRFMAAAWINDGKDIAYATGETESAKQNIELWKQNIESRERQKISSDTWFQVKSILWIEEKKDLLLLGRKRLSEQNQIWKYNFSSGSFEKVLRDTNYYTDFTATSDGEKILALDSKNNFSLYLGDIDNPQNAKPLVKSYRGVSWAKDGRLFYASNINNNDDIWSISADGSNAKQLTFNDSTDYLPKLTFDNSVVYVSDQAGVNHIMKMNSDGTNAARLTDEEGGTSPSISSDGKFIVYNSLETDVLVKMNSDGSNKRPLTNLRGNRPAISADSSMIAFFQSSENGDSSPKISVIDFATGEHLKSFALNGRSVSAWRILWKPDNSGFYYSTYHSRSTSVLWFQSMAAQPANKIAEFQNQQLFDFDISPDGKNIALIRGNWEKDAVLINNLY